MSKRKANAAARPESLQAKRRRVATILKKLRRRYSGGRRTALDHVDALQMVVATILSAQCTDKQVNLVTPELFKRYKTAADYAGSDIGELEGLIKSTGFYRNKARNITGCCRKLMEEHGGKVPREMEKLVTLPGIGRKTANVIKYAVWGDNDGIAVDTHVGRLSRRLGLSERKDPEKVERDLIEAAPRDARGELSWLLIQHGRTICAARRPLCGECMLSAQCPSAGHAEDIK
ncbi:MAG: endonuclease III [Planctomycetes bacterium]|nr:endonuclease III [Planctomycetota bacterium]